MAEFDESLVTTEVVAWADPETEVRVRYDGKYAGIVKKDDDGDFFNCAARRERDGQPIDQDCGRADSIKQGAMYVGQQFFVWNYPIK